MTKRDYELIAKAIQDAARALNAGRGPAKESAEAYGKTIGEVVAQHIRFTNDRFDSERFVRACTGEDERPHARVRRQKTLRDNKARVQRTLGGG